MLATDLTSLPKFSMLQLDQKHKLQDAVDSLKEEIWLELWLDSYGLPEEILQRYLNQKDQDFHVISIIVPYKDGNL